MTAEYDWVHDYAVATLISSYTEAATMVAAAHVLGLKCRVEALGGQEFITYQGRFTFLQTVPEKMACVRVETAKPKAFKKFEDWTQTMNRSTVWNLLTDKKNTASLWSPLEEILLEEVTS